MADPGGRSRDRGSSSGWQRIPRHIRGDGAQRGYARAYDFEYGRRTFGRDYGRGGGEREFGPRAYDHEYGGGAYEREIRRGTSEFDLTYRRGVSDFEREPGRGEFDREYGRARRRRVRRSRAHRGAHGRVRDRMRRRGGVERQGEWSRGESVPASELPAGMEDRERWWYAIGPERREDYAWAFGARRPERYGWTGETWRDGGWIRARRRRRRRPLHPRSV